MTMILAGDIGGTSTRLGLFEIRDARVEPVRTRIFPSRDYPGLGGMAKLFLAGDGGKVKAACFGIAGPVRHGRVTAPNLPWETDSKVLEQELGIPKVRLINDLEANAQGIPALHPSDMVVLQAGEKDARGNAAVISAGTGLGEAGMFWNGTEHIPFACEGGHADFAPRNGLESELLVYLHGKFERVSYERVLSGAGLYLLYEFLRDVKGRPEIPALATEMKAGNPSTVVTRAGLEAQCPLCSECLDWYVSLYGAEAGNLALKMMATGGVYVGGGIAPKIIAKMKGPGFLQSFLAKGRMRPLMESIAIRVIMNDKTALLGAARVGGTMV